MGNLVCGAAGKLFYAGKLHDMQGRLSRVAERRTKNATKIADLITRRNRSKRFNRGRYNSFMSAKMPMYIRKKPAEGPQANNTSTLTQEELQRLAGSTKQDQFVVCQDNTIRVPNLQGQLTYDAAGNTIAKDEGLVRESSNAALIDPLNSSTTNSTNNLIGTSDQIEVSFLPPIDGNSGWRQMTIQEITAFMAGKYGQLEAGQENLLNAQGQQMVDAAHFACQLDDEADEWYFESVKAMLEVEDKELDMEQKTLESSLKLLEGLQKSHEQLFDSAAKDAAPKFTGNG